MAKTHKEIYTAMQDAYIKAVDLQVGDKVKVNEPKPRRFSLNNGVTATIYPDSAMVQFSGIISKLSEGDINKISSEFDARREEKENE